MKYIKAIRRRVFSIIYLSFIKMFHISSFSFNPVQNLSFSTYFNILGGKISLGRSVGTRRNVEFRVSEGGEVSVGEFCFFNNGCIINSQDSISIGERCMFGPNVMVYDHDHDFRVPGGISKKKYKKAPIIIGKNVWIGAGCIILRGTIIGDNSVVAAGCVIRGEYPENSVIIQKRLEEHRSY